MIINCQLRYPRIQLNANSVRPSVSIFEPFARDRRFPFQRPNLEAKTMANGAKIHHERARRALASRDH